MSLRIAALLCGLALLGAACSLRTASAGPPNQVVPPAVAQAGPSPAGAAQADAFPAAESSQGAPPAAASPATGTATFPITRTDEEWRRLLTPEQYRVLRSAGTELSCSGAFWDNHEAGTYRCAGCGNPLFLSDHKFDSGTGWPSYYQPIRPDSVGTRLDTSHGMTRTEVHCARCGGHLGHIFEDGPRPTGLRYCINSAAMVFVPKK